MLCGGIQCRQHSRGKAEKVFTVSFCGGDTSYGSDDNINGNTFLIRKVVIMTKMDVCNLLDISESAVRTNFRRVADKFFDRGIIIYKEGYGKTVEYFIEEYWEGAIKQYLDKHFHRVVATKPRKKKKIIAIKRDSIE